MSTPDREDYTGSVVIEGDVTLAEPVEVYGTVSISGTVTVSGSVSITGTVTITGTVAVSGTVTVSGTVAISGTVTVSGAVTVTSGSITFTNTSINVGTVGSITGTVTITGTVAVSGTVTVSGSVTIASGTVAISGTVNISGPVTVTSGSINVATAGGTNIIIDKLTQTAYTSNQRVLTNEGTVASDVEPYYWAFGKYFPRGCRGVINYVGFVMKNTSGADRTITYWLQPYPGGPTLYTDSFTLASTETTYAVRTRNPYLFWNYDGMFILMKTSAAGAYLATDAGTPSDDFEILVSTAPRGTPNPTDKRDWIRVSIYGLSVGDLPVSGTVNTIAIPNTVGLITHSTKTDINGGTTVDLLATVYGAGELFGLNVFSFQQPGSTVPPASQIIGIVIDGTAFEVNAEDVRHITGLGTGGGTAPFVFIMQDVNLNVYAWAMTKHLPFQRSLRIYARNGEAAGPLMTAEVMFIYTLLK